MIDIENILNILAAKRPIFHSEADFQHSLAWEIHNIYPESKIRLEVPPLQGTQKERTDISVICNDYQIAIELKYKKEAIRFTHDNEYFNLRSDGARDTGCYDFIKDIGRLERRISSNSLKSIGYAIMLSNDPLYWENSNRVVNYEAFLLHEGRQLMKNEFLEWHKDTAVGTKKDRSKPHKLDNDYNFSWKDYSTLPIDNKNNLFKYLAVKISPTI